MKSHPLRSARAPEAARGFLLRRTALAAAAASLAVALVAWGKGQETRPPAPAPTPAASAPVAPIAAGASDISIILRQESGRRVPIAIPPAIAPLTPEFQKEVVEPFSQTLRNDLSLSPYFVVADPALYPKGARPPAGREEGDQWIAAGAQFLLDTQVQPDTTNIVVTVNVIDLRTLRPVLSRKYSPEGATMRRVAHVAANEIVRQFSGRPGPFLSKLVFVSDRDGARNKELYVMDYDGANQRRVTFHRALTISPDWSFDGERIVYQSFLSGRPALYWIRKEGGEKTQIPLSTDLNSSPSFSPDGKTVAFCGSVRGNPEIFTASLDGSNVKRLTNSSAIDSTPRFAPNGREIAFTSNRQGSPQIYLMDLEGANVRRLTLAGSFSDEAAFSPDGTKMAYACRNEGEFQICLLDLVTSRTFQITQGGGSSENPTWSPDGTMIAWEFMRGGSTQVVSANADGTNVRTLTTAASNWYPAWSRTLE